jgi:nitrogen fixation/metabolism regulation signal transduction histidine kinase
VTDWRRRWQRYRRQNRFLIALYLVLLVLAVGGFALFSRLRGLPSEELTNRLLFFLLWWFDLTLIVVLLFILVRNTVKLLLERHHGILGSRFRTKLLLSYLVLILLPTALLSVLAAALLSQASASWFTAPVEEMARTGSELAREVRLASQGRAQRSAATIARELAGLGDGDARTAQLERLHTLLGNDFTGLFVDSRSAVELADPRERRVQRLPPLDLEATHRSGVRSDRSGGTVIVRAWERLPGGAVVVVGEVVPDRQAALQGRLATAGAEYERLKLERPTMTATALLSFGALALLVAFAAMWLGLYLSRTFTAPLLALVATTNRVAAGDTLDEVPIPAEDEVGLLVGSFNAMVRRLRGQEKELRATVGRLDAVLGAVRTGVLTLDAERASAHGNPAAATLLGEPRLAAGTVPLDELAAGGLARLVDVVRAARGLERSSLVIHRGGVARTLEAAVVPLGDERRVEGWVVALEDMTQLVRAQRQAAWSEVARQIAHQIKNPLTPIRLAAERMARHVERGADDLKEVVPQGCRAIVEHVQSMQEMVDAFSRYARLPATSRRPTRVGELARQAAALYDGVRPGLEVRVEDRLGDREVLVDPEQFRQVLTNLIDNAVEASGADGEVSVTVRPDGADVVVEVTDQGRGLDATDPELLFQPFYSTKGRGSGIGLAVVQRIVSDHGGSVRLEANRPRGARAVVRLPGGDA